MLDDDSADLAEALKKMREEAEETERRCTDAAGNREGKKTAILDKAAETKKEAKAFMDIYLDEESDELDGFEFLTMTEAGEAGHWAILGKVNEKAGEDGARPARRLGAADPGTPPRPKCARARCSWPPRRTPTASRT